jgi:hypothetical protein
MRLFKKLLGACCLTIMFLGLAACQNPPNVTQIDSTISSQPVQTGIQFACLALTGAEAGWNVYMASHKVSPDNVHNANVAIAGVASICTPPYPQNSADVVAKVIAAAVTVTQALQNESPPVVAAPPAAAAAPTS